MQNSKYRILGLVGQGQFGRVFCASLRESGGKNSRPVGQLVALKELSHTSAPTSEFLRELWFLITLQHPNIVACIALEHTATGRYLVMDYCEGGTLRSLLKQDSPLRLLEGLQLVIGVLAGLDYAHRRGVVHCDIKPENILLSLGPKGWLPRLSDFGIARRLPEIGTTRLHQEISPDATVGSPAYMAPERFYGLYSPMSDIYAVGILLFELLMGYRPFSGTPGDLMWAHLNQRLQLPEVIPEPLQEVLKKALEKLPARRFASASHMAQALRLAMYDRAVRQLGDHAIPWEGGIENDEEEDRPRIINFHLPITASQLSVPAPVTILVANEAYLYGAAGSQVIILPQPHQSLVAGKVKTSVSFPESVLGILPALGGSCILTQERLYWLGDRASQPECILDIGDIGLETIPTLYKAAVDFHSRCLAVAISGELRFYSLAIESGSITLTLKRTIALTEPNLPELMFLDRRHLLATWPDTEQKQPQTTFKVYSRRGTTVGSVRLLTSIGQAIAQGNQLLSTAEPYTLLGMPLGSKSAILLIKLLPLKVARIPLESLPTCACATSWGYFVADAQGQILVCDRKGSQIGNFSSPVVPKAIAPWGKTGLAITADSGCIHFLDVNFETDP
ncbi:serine/threonine-protein kinase [Kamptonema sp. UHCC 0994]|uniref:serine/threonine-protein kinase n=1 Tax=Kamptonema sp. UHCC 0994 TaxID=3031329 RepID=UPI0023B9D737|nr:serine/threonine-protein kinase [Kamptonema sp. UHCC 0994]MDF0554745.1 serine/threonine-protein kinase [Kamptonema sp. UHCC 0994]